MRIALDATYSLGSELSGVGVYSRRTMFGLAAAHPGARFDFCYRPHRWLRSWREQMPANCARSLLIDWPSSRVDLFHGLNQRLPRTRFRRAVTTFHDLFVLTGEYSTPEFRRRFAEQARRAAMAADLVLSVSAFTASQVADCLGIARDNIRVTPHGADLPQSVVPPEARDRVVLHVGSIQRRKNVARLVDAFRAVASDWRLVLVGGSGYGCEEALDRILASPCRDRITVTGYVSQAELEQWYACASVLAFPSLDEGFGIPVLEAMAAGVAVMTSDRSALPEVAGDAALLVDPFRTEEIAEALIRLTTDGDLRADLVSRGRRRAAQFSWERSVNATWESYMELTGGSAIEGAPG